MQATLSAILVLTHNGKPPQEGGKRIGYQAGDFVFIIGCGTYSASALLEQKRQAEAVALKEKLQAQGILVYNELHRSRNWSETCPHCGGRGECVFLSTDVGDKDGFKCRSCSKNYLPYEY